MKKINTLLAIASISTLASQTQALTTVEWEATLSDLSMTAPGSGVSLGSVSTPLPGGTLSIDIDAGAVAGASFNADAFDIGVFGGAATVTQNARTDSFASHPFSIEFVVYPAGSLHYTWGTGSPSDLNTDDGSTLTAGGGASCAGASTICASVPTHQQSYDHVELWLLPDGQTGWLEGLLVITEYQTAANFTTTTYSLAPSEVPVPAAAWLFGSAIVGLAGIGRKRQLSK